MSRRLVPILALAASFAVLGLSGGVTPAEATPANCPARFQVLHADSIGDLRLPAAGYELKVGDPGRLSCASAAKDFAEFLGDYDGVLRKPWVQVPGRQIFQRGPGSLTAFTFRPVAGLDPAIPPTGNPTAYSCPGFYRVRHDDHIGSLAIPEGAYRISLIDPLKYNCAASVLQLTRFLQDVDGVLSTPWGLNTQTGTFQRGKGSPIGFRVKQAIGAEPVPAAGVRFPAKGQPAECPGTFRVGGDGDRINSLTVHSGNYLLFPQKGSGLSCKRVSALFTRFLGARKNTAPKPWKVDAGNGVFKKGKRPGFRVKPALAPVAKAPTPPTS